MENTESISHTNMADLDFWQSILECCSDSQPAIPPLEPDARNSDIFEIAPFSGEINIVDKEYGAGWEISNWSTELESSIPAIPLPIEIPDGYQLFPSANSSDTWPTNNPIDPSVSMCAADERDKETNGKKRRISHQRFSSSMNKITDITMNELSRYFNMPIAQAAKELNVGLTVLKKKCREFGIPRWPHRKMKSLECLISNIQELAGKNNGGLANDQLRDTVQILQEQRKLMDEMPGIEIPERTKRLRQACFKASYKKRRRMAIESPNHEPPSL